MAIDKESFWAVEGSYNRPELTEEMIQFAEQSLQVTLPSTFIGLLKKRNGGNTKGFVFPMKQKTSWSDNHVPLSELFGIVTDKSARVSGNILETDYMTKEWGLPPRQVLLTGEGDWWLTLDYRKSDDPTVRWIDVDSNEDIHVAGNFDEFINGLVPEDEFDAE